MTKLEELARSLIAHKLITSTTGSISDRAKRRMDKAAEKAYDILKKKESKIVTVEEMKVGLSWSNKQVSWARNIDLALEEFRQEHPRWGKALDKTIDQHRKARRAYIRFEGEIPEEIYIGIICDLIKDTTPEEAKQIYYSALILQEKLKKKRGPNYVILPE